MSDKYDDAVAWLTEHPQEISYAWTCPYTTRGGELFKRVSISSTECGCLTQIKSGGYFAATPELTAAIRADERIPSTLDDITVGSLPVFAEWQRRIDRELRGE